MEQIVVKTEVQPNGEILLYYVDENAIDGSEHQVLHLEEAADYEVLEGDQEIVESKEALVQIQEQEYESDQPKEISSKWSIQELQKLLIFFFDNKDNFNASSNQHHLWNVACNTILVGRTEQQCEIELLNLKRKYAKQNVEHQNGYIINWPLYELCHQAFHDDTYVAVLIKDFEQQQQTVTKISIPNKVKPSSPGTIIVKNITTKPQSDNKVETMLRLYLRYKKIDFTPKNLWEIIAVELGEDSAEYWHKRFLNFKQHYLRMLPKRQLYGPASVNWPYMHFFDQIFADDPVFQSKYVTNGTEATVMETDTQAETEDWNDTEYTILAKYYFDCFDEFQDVTIPKQFLWTEIGRLLDKKPDICKVKYEEIKNTHYEKYLSGTYILSTRVPLEIILDNIISQEVELEMSNECSRRYSSWATEDIDKLVQFFYDNVEMFKDPICHFVCYASISKFMDRDILSCKAQWESLKVLYKSILQNKMENSDLQIEWRYIDMFDRIFDYGMDTNLLNEIDKSKGKKRSKTSEKIGVQKVNINMDNETNEEATDEEGFDERGFTKRTNRSFGDSKAFKILEYYLKHKDKFATTQHKKKQYLWGVIAKKLGISVEQCAHRFRNLKQVYMRYIQREIDKPEMPILWPYYPLCKRVFGYRALKSKLKSKSDPEEEVTWTTKDIKLLADHCSKRGIGEIAHNDDLSNWKDIAIELRRPAAAVRDKFLALRKSYKRLKTVQEHNPSFKISWKYYQLFDKLWSNANFEEEFLEEYDDQYLHVKNDDDDEYQCIIVIPEDGDINDISASQIIIQRMEETEVPDIEIKENIKATKWTKKTKKRLLIIYHNYIKAKKGEKIKPKEMWSEIASKLAGKTPVACRRMFVKLKLNHLKTKDTENKDNDQYYGLLEKILALKRKFAKNEENNLHDRKIYKNVDLPIDKVELALQYYLQNIDEFASPKFEKKYLWTELAKFVAEPLNKLFNKINYLKQNYNVETGQVSGEETAFNELLKEIVTKENAITAEISEHIASDEHDEVNWSDDETEQLLVWYLANLDKFKNPKFVRKYLWLEVSSVLTKAPLACSKKMTEVRTQYKTMIKGSPDELSNWRFSELCQKIYGTGKKNEVVQNEQTE